MKFATKILSVLLTIVLLMTSVVFVLPATAGDIDPPSEDGNGSSENPNENEGGEGESAEYDGKSWLLYAADSFQDGVKLGDPHWGDKEKPYKISNGAELAYLALCSQKARIDSAYFVLTDNIDLGAHEWFPIAGPYSGPIMGDTVGVFNGDSKDLRINNCDFNGQGFTISNMTVTSSASYYAGRGTGLFSCLSGSTNIHNLTMTGVKIKVDLSGKDKATQYDSVAAVTVVTTGASKITDVTVEDAEIEVTAPAANWLAVGGVCGNHYNGTLTRCSVSGSVTVHGNTTNNSSVGGLVGQIANRATVDSCTNDADVTLDGIGKVASAAGGIAASQGFFDQTKATVKNTTSNGNITVLVADASENFNIYVGGLIGHIGRNTNNKELKDPEFTVSDCYSNGEINVSAVGNKSYVGGLLGYWVPDGEYVVKVTLEKCFSTAVLTVAGSSCGSDMALVGNYEEFMKEAYGNTSSQNAYLDYNNAIEVISGARLRLNPSFEKYSELRFTANVNLELLEMLRERGATLSYGMIFATKEELDAAAENAKTNADLVANLKSADRFNYSGEMEEVIERVFVPCDPEVVGSKDHYEDRMISYGFSLSRNTISDFNQEYGAIAFISIIMGDRTYICYSSYNSESARSTAEVATAYLDGYRDNGSAYFAFTDYQLALLRSYLPNEE